MNDLRKVLTVEVEYLTGKSVRKCPFEWLDVDEFSDRAESVLALHILFMPEGGI